MPEAQTNNYDFIEETHHSLLTLLVQKRAALLKAATKITGCRSRAEDVVQDAYLRLSAISLKELPPKAKTSYLYNVVRNLAIDHYRKREIEQKYFCSEEEGSSVDTNSATPDAICHHQEMLNLIDSALSQLPERTRYAFEMYRIHGKQQKEIARELGVSPTLVNFMVRDALIHCKNAIATERQRSKK